MLTTTVRVGRLIEILGRDTITLDEVVALQTTFKLGMERTNRTTVVIADLRGATVQGEPAFEAILKMMKTVNPRVERMAFLLDRGSLLALRLVQLTAAANNRARKVCSTPAEVEKWCSPVLTQEERERLRAVMAEFMPNA